CRAYRHRESVRDRPEHTVLPTLKRTGQADPSTGSIRGRRERNPWRDYCLLMRLATTAAPYPLSMFTTVTFDAQLFSIASSAASPLKLAPYPILVGTAITGTETRPPTTLGSAPSMPATTITTRALVQRSRRSSNR